MSYSIHPLLIPQVALGPAGKAKMYPILSGKTEFRQSLIDNFPDEVEAIDKFLGMLKVRKFRCVYMDIYFYMLKIKLLDLPNTQHI